MKLEMVSLCVCPKLYESPSQWPGQDEVRTRKKNYKFYPLLVLSRPQTEINISCFYFLRKIKQEFLMRQVRNHSSWKPPRQPAVGRGLCMYRTL